MCTRACSDHSLTFAVNWGHKVYLEEQAMSAAQKEKMQMCTYVSTPNKLLCLSIALLTVSATHTTSVKGVIVAVLNVMRH